MFSSQQTPSSSNPVVAPALATLATQINQASETVTDNVAIGVVFHGCPIPAAPAHIQRLNQLFPHRHWSFKNFHCAKCGTKFDATAAIVRQQNQYLCWPCYVVVFGSDTGMVDYQCSVCERVVYARPRRFTGVCSHRCQQAKTAQRNRLQKRLSNPVRNCSVCGVAIPHSTGRADKRYCSSAHRQAAYRLRSTEAAP